MRTAIYVTCVLVIAGIVFLGPPYWGVVAGASVALVTLWVDEICLAIRSTKDEKADRGD